MHTVWKLSESTLHSATVVDAITARAQCRLDVTLIVCWNQLDLVLDEVCRIPTLASGTTELNCTTFLTHRPWQVAHAAPALEQVANTVPQHEIHILGKGVRRLLVLAIVSKPELVFQEYPAQEDIQPFLVVSVDQGNRLPAKGAELDDL